MSYRAHFVCLIAVLIPAAGYASGIADPPFRGSFLYENAERTSYFAINNGNSIAGPITSKKKLGPQNDLLADEALGEDVYDCSNTHYRCLKMSRIVLAVPRKRLSPKETYEIAGTVFSIIDCLRGVGSVCQVALIRADCQQIKDAETCVLYPGGRAKAPHPGPITYFIYNEDFGITSIGFPDEEPKDEGWIAKRARDYVLRGDVGLLKQQ